MKNKVTNRLLSLSLVVLMSLSCTDLTAYAAEPVGSVSEKTVTCDSTAEVTENVATNSQNILMVETADVSHLTDHLHETDANEFSGFTFLSYTSKELMEKDEAVFKSHGITVEENRDVTANAVTESDETYDPSILTDAGYVPDWKYMEKYMFSLPYSDRI